MPKLLMNREEFEDTKRVIRICK